MLKVYVLYSEKYDKTYIGYTSNLEQRLFSHNVLSNKGWTIKYRPWEILIEETYESKGEAMKREKKLNGGQGRLWIRNIIKDKH